MLTVEMNEVEERVEIYANREGLMKLQRSISILLAKGGHDHLMTPSWAGNELTEDAQGKGTRLVNHLLLVLRDE